MQQPNILIVEDDPILNEQLTSLLKAKGFTVEHCYDGEKGLRLATENHYDMVLLDILLPKRDGLSVLGILRNAKQTPVILVSAKGAEEERIRGLSKGADDFISKPFHPDELLLRIDAILRRCSPKAQPPSQQLIALDKLHVDMLSQKVDVDGERLELTPIQFKLLLTLLQNKGEVLSKAFLYQVVLNKNYGAHDRSLDMHLSRVRRKLSEANWNGERLRAVHGKGYCLT